MKNLYLLLFLYLFISCSHTKDSENINTNNTVNITIGNENFSITTQNQISSNENCENLFVSAVFNNLNDVGFRIEFKITKKGVIRNIALYNYRESNKIYESADFNPISVFEIKNFVYNPNTGNLNFEFEGNLVEVNSSIENLDLQHNQKFIKGNVYIKNITKINCNSAFSKINFETNNLIFSTNNTFASFNSSQSTNSYQFNFYSENGNKIIFKNATDIWVLPTGEYFFNQYDVENRIDFEKYIGNIRATQLLWVRPIDWKKYTTSGSYLIQEHKFEYGMKLTKGLFNLNINDNGTPIYTINNAKFEVLGF